MDAAVAVRSTPGMVVTNRSLAARSLTSDDLLEQ
jgi:hypothetical protein